MKKERTDLMSAYQKT